MSCSRLGLLPVQLEHGVELISEVGEHGSDVVQNVPRVPPRLLHAPSWLYVVQRPVGKANARVGSHPDRAGLLVGKRNPRLAVKAGVSLQL